MSAIIAALSSAPNAPVTGDYDGLEFRWKMFTFRPAMFKVEGIMLSVLGVYLLVYALGRMINQSRATAM